MSELRRFSTDFQVGSKADQLTIREQSDGLIEVAQDDGDRECRHAMSLEQLNALAEELNLGPTLDPFAALSQFAFEGHAKELVGALHSENYLATYVWP